MKFSIIFLLLSCSCYLYASEGTNYSYNKHQDSPTIPLDATTITAHVPVNLSISYPKYNEGVMVLVDGVVVFYVRDKVNKIEFGKRDNGCAIL